MNVKDLEPGYGVKIKFASLGENGLLVRECASEYISLFDEVPAGWEFEDCGLIETRYEGLRDSWMLRSGDTELAAVSHETGLEILLAFGVNVGSAAMIGLVSWAFKRWRESRESEVAAGTKTESSLIAERIEECLPDGTARRTTRLVIRPPFEDADISRAMLALQSK